MKTSEKNEAVEVFTSKGWQAGVVKSLPESFGIEAILRD